jgi:zinc/manganese transport system substrate-binding protein
VVSRCWRALVIGFLLASGAMPAAAQTRLKAVATNSILADFTRNVGGDRVDVSALIGPDSDVHVFDPKPADAKALAAANVVVMNGLGLEGWMTRLVAASGTKARVVVASEGIGTRSTADEHHRGQTVADPHAWQSVADAKRYAANIRDGLTAADPDGKSAYDANYAVYAGRLDGLDADIRAAVSAIAPARRKLITNHAAFGYFADAYGMTFIAPEGFSTDSEASARDVARIITQIKAEAIPAVFLENVSDPRLVEQIARESGAKIGGKVYSDALSAPGGPAPTYVAMMRHNLRAFSQALSD